MIFLEIPKLTLTHELAALEDLAPNGYSEVYAAGARAALLWLMDGKTRPSIALSNQFEPESPIQ